MEKREQTKRLPFPRVAARGLAAPPTLSRYLSTISRPQLLHTHLPGGQTEPEAMDRGEDDGDSGAEEEHESSSPAPSGLTCRKPRGAVAGGSRPLPSPPNPTGPWGSPSASPLLQRPPPPLSAQLVRSHFSALTPSAESKLRPPPPPPWGCDPLTSRTPGRPTTLPSLPRRLSSPPRPGPSLPPSLPLLPPAPRGPAALRPGPPPRLSRSARTCAPPHSPGPLPRRLCGSSRPPGLQSARTLPT